MTLSDYQTFVIRIVAPGRSVVRDNGLTAMPGEKVTLSTADANRLFNLGYVCDAAGRPNLQG